VSRGIDGDVPSKPFGDATEYSWSPDGKLLAFNARIAGRTEAWSTNFDIFVAPADASALPKNLTETNPAWDAGPVFSADGGTLYYRAMTRPGFEADRFALMAMDLASGKTREIAPRWDASADGIALSADGKRIYTTAYEGGRHPLFAVDIATGEVGGVAGNGKIEAFDLRGDTLAFTRSTLQGPAQLFISQANGEAKQVSDFNATKLDSVTFGAFEQFAFPGWNDETVHGYVVKPAGFEAGKKYPVAFLIHGGPQGSFGNHFHYRWNPQTYAGAGYAAVMIDFHGSTGYGQAFTDAIRGDWGGKPLVDLQKGLDAALGKYTWLDGTRVCALGASYGGYMINWIAGNWPDRFQCLVNHDGNLDERMAYYDTEELWFPEWEHGGTPWENPAGYAKHNPIDHIAKWKTPMLVIHGGRDYRVVDTQGMSTFTALQRKGIPSRFLYFPDENHWVLKPKNSIQWYDEVFGWMGRWTGRGTR
jgi:dipeptidyl aminopeptidase/acylaminoacyl peptidase